jgi:HK97 gp10 family phage protein
MTVKVEFKVHGLKELQKALTQLPKELVSSNGGPVRTALMAATLPVVRTAQATIPDRDDVQNSGQLARAIRRRRMTKVRKGSEGVQVYVRGGKRDDPNGAYYAPWVEFGARGLPPTRWFTKSLETNAKPSTEIFRKSLAGSIERIAKKIGNENLRQVGARIKKL